MGGRGSGSRMGSSTVAESGAAYGGRAAFSDQQITNASDDYWNTGWGNKRESAKILSGDITEDEYVKRYVKEGIKSDKDIQDIIDRNGRDYTNRNWSARSRAEWEARGRETYKREMETAKQYAVGDIAKRLGVGINWSASESEARKALGDKAYNDILGEAKRSAKRAVDSHKRRR